MIILKAKDWSIPYSEGMVIESRESVVHFESGSDNKEYPMPSQSDAADFVRRLKIKLGNLKLFGETEHVLDLDIIAWETKFLTKRLLNQEK